MSSIENLIKKIESDSSEKSKQILDAALEKADQISKESKDKLDLKSSAILAKANREYNIVKDKQVDAAKLKARDMVLCAKQEVADKIIIIIKEKLNNLSEEKYIKYLKNSLEEGNFSKNAKISVSKKYLGALKASDIEIKISDEFVESGFSVSEGNIKYNGQFDNLVEAQKDDLEVEIFDSLFSEGGING